jgi:hypothetical protein
MHFFAAFDGEERITYGRARWRGPTLAWAPIWGGRLL